MNTYQYQALKPSGKTTKGFIEAESDRHARQLLREQGLIPTHLQPFKKRLTHPRRKALSTAHLCLMTRQLATLLSAGIPLEEALHGVGEQSTEPSVRAIIFHLRTKVLEGYGLAQAMGEETRAFPELYRATIAAGEQTGQLDSVLEKLADYTEYQQSVRQKIQQALIYPIVMILVSIAIISFLLSYVVPKIIEVFDHNHQHLPPTTRLLITLSDFMKDHGILIISLLVLLTILAPYSLKYPSIRQQWDLFLLRIPGLSFIVQTTHVARYTHTFSILFSAGVSVLDTMRVCASLMTNTAIQHDFQEATQQVKEGIPIHYALAQTTRLNPMAIHLIASGEKSGQLSSMMARTALHLDQEVRRILDTAMTLLEPCVILIMGGVILFIVLATLLPIFSMQQLIT